MKPIKWCLAWLACAAAIAMSGCAPGADGVKQGLSTTSRIVATGYRSLSAYDVKRQMELRAHAPGDPTATAAQFTSYLTQYDKAIKALNGAADVVNAAYKFEMLYEQGAAKKKDASQWIVNLASAALAVSQALQEMGVL